MAFPYANEHSVSATLLDVGEGTTPVSEIISAEFALFQVPRSVDVSGMELAVGVNVAPGTGLVQSVASGTTTVVLKPYDGATSASAASDNNELFAVTDFSNSLTGGWTAHQARKAVGTSTTDLDADDWVNMDVAANLTTTAGIGQMVVSAFFIYGVPAAPA